MGGVSVGVGGVDTAMEHMALRNVQVFNSW